MVGLGIDIGTTTICGVAMDKESGRVLEAVTLPNDAAVSTADEWEKLQDVERIWTLCRQIAEKLQDRYQNIKTIGISGQMHGILYVDAQGNAVSPLYSWQDGRGNREYRKGLTYCEYLTRETGIAMATGYGLTTHFYNQVNNLVPAAAVTLCTIGDYIAMKLSGRQRPVMHKSMAASLGFFSVKKGEFDKEAFARLGMDSSILPEVGKSESSLSECGEEIMVSMALGDNQASFLGSVDNESATLVNIGTGSQISVYAATCDERANVEYRPYIDGSFLIVGSPLCGGASYAMLKRFFEKTLELFGQKQPENIYDIMNMAADDAYGNAPQLTVDTRFKGTRTNPGKRGVISNIDFDNFTPQNLVLGMLKGICTELFQIYENIPLEYRQRQVITGSGNGIRENQVMQKVLADMFGKTIKIPPFKEEAAAGAALYALLAAGYYSDLGAVQEVISMHKGRRT